MSEIVPTEREEAKVLHDYLAVKGHKHTAIVHENYRNGGFRGAMNKRVGVSAGFPDYVIIVNDNVIYLELKRKKGGRVSEQQKEWHNALEQAGQTVWVCKGAEEAIENIKKLEREV